MQRFVSLTRRVRVVSGRPALLSVLLQRCSFSMSLQAHPAAGRAQDCIYLSNLPYDATAGTIKEVFDKEKIPVSSVQLIKKGSFNRQHNSGLACVVLSKSSDVDNSCKALDGKDVMGRPMIVRKDRFESDQPSYQVPAAAAAGQPAGQPAAV